MIEIIVIVLLLVLCGGMAGYIRRLRQQYAALGMRRDTQTATITTLERRVSELENQNNQSQDQLENQQRTISGLEMTLTEKEGRIIEQNRQITEKVRQFADLQKQFTDFKQGHDKLKGEMAYKTALTLTLANAAFEALLVVDKDCQIVAVNNSAELLFGYEKPVNQSLAEVTNAPELEMMVGDALINEEESFEEQMIINRRNYRVQSQVIRRDGNLFIGLALQDITRLVRLNRARRDMVANISHELRTPIANIRLIIDGLFHDQDKPKRKDSISSLRAIARETDNLLWLVQEMSDLSMIESGQAIVRLVDVSLAELVDEAIERMMDQSSFRQVKIVRHIPEKLHVLCDRDLAQRVLVNLMHNAIKWSPEDDAVTVNAISNDEEVTISVVDNGPGVPEDQVDRIFERFYQVDASRSGGEGSGLGLAICRHIVEAHGGRIWAESNKDGSGGRFLFTLLSASNMEDDEEEIVMMPQMPLGGVLPEPVVNENGDHTGEDSNTESEPEDAERDES